jgi:6-bladed beta-propeller
MFEIFVPPTPGCPMRRRNLPSDPVRRGSSVDSPSYVLDPADTGRGHQDGEFRGPVTLEQLPHCLGPGSVVRNVVIALAAAAASACGGDASQHAVAEPIVDTLNGVVHVRNSPEGAWAGEERWSVEEIMRLGARDSPREELFSGPLLTTATCPDGSTYVLDYDAGSISVFSAEGAFVRRIGRRGRGPGEFMAPVGLSRDAFDRLWVADGAGRLTGVNQCRGRKRACAARW